MADFYSLYVYRSNPQQLLARRHTLCVGLYMLLCGYDFRIYQRRLYFIYKNSRSRFYSFGFHYFAWNYNTASVYKIFQLYFPCRNKSKKNWNDFGRIKPRILFGLTRWNRRGCICDEHSCCNWTLQNVFPQKSR